MKYRKKPVVIEAEPWWPDEHPNKPKGALPEMAFPEVTRWDEKPCYGWCKTLEGGHIVTPGDYIITGVKGEHYSCKPDIFRATYLKVSKKGALKP